MLVSKKFQFEGFVLFRIFRSTPYKNKVHNFFLTIISTKVFARHFDATDMTWNMNFLSRLTFADWK